MGKCVHGCRCSFASTEQHSQAPACRARWNSALADRFQDQFRRPHISFAKERRHKQLMETHHGFGKCSPQRRPGPKALDTDLSQALTPTATFAPSGGSIDRSTQLSTNVSAPLLTGVELASTLSACLLRHHFAKGQDRITAASPTRLSSWKLPSAHHHTRTTPPAPWLLNHTTALDPTLLQPNIPSSPSSSPAPQPGNTNTSTTTTSLPLAQSPANKTMTVAFDLVGAFNGVNNTSLNARLQAKGIPLSEEASLDNAGLAQGSPLSPILIAFFNCDLVDQPVDFHGGASAFIDDYPHWRDRSIGPENTVPLRSGED
ncbi:hypothetical protein PEBR_21891 [Penicillium brasilianum]|uniref:Reverse transcriptase domain-containing protein n=1 Tax=Penicillium brasilianum TaxID=104259 RepID=A0A1S9RLB2_PENBI|nr:hypothetical protein PEBR_21891 [Penicillium brasilianum]